MHRGCADEQVFEGNPDSFCSLLPFDASGEPRDFQCHGIYRHISRQSVDKLQSSVLLLLVLGAIGSMNQLGDAHDRDADLDLAALRRTNLFQDLPDGVASALGRDDDARVVDYSHAGGFQGLR